jgi:hypothetical protein
LAGASGVKPTRAALAFWDGAPAPLAPTVEGFLRQLGGPAVLRIAGRDRSRTRAVSTLLHGNEPSGVRALHAWLREGAAPAVDALLVIGNVAAALEPPGFAHRMLPGRRDLNRCFLGPFEHAEGELARAILDAIRKATPEALVDVHNNTGHNPAYGVGVAPEPRVLELAALFGDRFVESDLRIGALIEAVRELPSVTAEVGRSGDLRADAHALQGIRAFLGREPLFTDVPPPLRRLVEPMRATLRPGVRVAVADAPVADSDLTVSADLDRHNFEVIAPGVAIGWVANAACPLELRDARGRDRAAEYFRVEAGRLVTRRAFVPIMITTDPGIARSDCLFYVAREAPPA